MALGKIKADTLEHSTAGSLDTQYVVNGSAKAWVNFNGTASGATARDSFNNSSMTDSSTGNHSVNFSNNFSNANYASVAALGNNDASNPGGQGTVTVGHTTSGLSSTETTNSANGNNNDWAQMSHTSHGDLA